jgi:hypothetical protein
MHISDASERVKIVGASYCPTHGKFAAPKFDDAGDLQSFNTCCVDLDTEVRRNLEAYDVIRITTTKPSRGPNRMLSDPPEVP